MNMNTTLSITLFSPLNYTADSGNNGGNYCTLNPLALSDSSTNASVELYHGDSRKMRIPHIDGIMTSPPYVGLIDYHEQHTYSYHLLGLTKYCHNEIGPASKGKSEEAKQQYKRDIAEVFRRALKVMKSGGHLIVVAHDRSNIYDNIANHIGVEVEGIVRRHVNRRTGRRGNSFFESVFIWRKR